MAEVGEEMAVVAMEVAMGVVEAGEAAMEGEMVVEVEVEVKERSESRRRCFISPVLFGPTEADNDHKWMDGRRTKQRAFESRPTFISAATRRTVTMRLVKGRRPA